VRSPTHRISTRLLASWGGLLPNRVALSAMLLQEDLTWCCTVCQIKTELATQCTERPDRKGGAAGNKSESFHLFVVTQATNAATNHFICTVTLHLARYVTEFWREGCKQVLWSGKFKTGSVPRCCGSDQKPLTVLLCFWLGVFCGRFLVSHNMP
jgi:hypothetical protein